MWSYHMFPVKNSHYIGYGVGGGSVVIPLVVWYVNTQGGCVNTTIGDTTYRGGTSA